MRIVEISVHHCPLDDHPNWHPVLVSLRSEDGLIGWGEAAAAYSPCSEAIAAHCLAAGQGLVLGQDAHRHAWIWERVRATGDCYGHGSVTASAAAAIEIACLDLVAQAHQVSVTDLVGGRQHQALRAYANGWCYDLREPAAYADAARGVVASGFTALKFDPFRSDAGGFSANPGPGQNRVAAWLRIAEARVAAVRDAIGPDVDLIIECHGKFTPDIAATVIAALVPYRPAFIEEPIGPPFAAAYPDLARRSPVPLAAGERCCHRRDIAPLITASALGLVQCDLGTTGIGEGLRIADLADLFGIAYQPHNANSPWLSAVSLQAGAAASNLRYQECFAGRPDSFMRFVHDPVERRLVDGYLPVPSGPGMGARIDTDYVARFPVRRATLGEGAT